MAHKRSKAKLIERQDAWQAKRIDIRAAKRQARDDAWAWRGARVRWYGDLGRVIVLGASPWDRATARFTAKLRGACHGRMMRVITSAMPYTTYRKPTVSFPGRQLGVWRNHEEALRPIANILPRHYAAPRLPKASGKPLSLIQVYRHMPYVGIMRDFNKVRANGQVSVNVTLNA